MLKTILIQCGAAVLILLAGIWIGKAATADAAGKGRVFELRTYTANEGKLDDLHARFRDHTLKLFQRHGMTNIIYCKPLDPPLSGNTLVYLLAHASREAATKSWEAFRNDPEWVKARDTSEANGKLVSKVESVFLEATDYSPMR